MQQEVAVGDPQVKPAVNPVVKEIKKIRQNVQKASKIQPKTKAAVQKKFGYIIAAMVAAVRAWWHEVAANFAFKSARKLKGLLAKIGKVILGFFDLDSKDKIDGLVKNTKSIVRSAGNQALAASLMALLTALAGGARQAMESIISKSEASVLKNIVKGSIDETMSSMSSEPSLFNRSNDPFNRAPEPPWGHSRPNPPPNYGGGFSDSWRKS